MKSSSPRSQVSEAVRLLSARWGDQARALQGRVRVLADQVHQVDGEFKGVQARVQTEQEDFLARYAGLRKGWTSDCSCGLNDGCAHVLLALCSVLNVDLGQMTPADAGVGSKVGEAEESPSKSEADAQGFQALVERKLGRVLSREEVGYVKRVEVLIERYAQSDQVPAEALESLVGSRRLTGAERFAVWPQQPTSAWEGWLYLAVFLQGRGALIPGFLGGLTTASELAGVEQGWVERISIQRWEEQLERLLADLDGSRARVAFELRLVFGSHAASLEWMRPGEPEWERVGLEELEEISRIFMESRMDGSSGSRVLLEGFLGACLGGADIGYARSESRERLARLLLDPMLRDRLVNAEREVFEWPSEPLEWELRQEAKGNEDYLLELLCADGSEPPPALFIVGGNLNCYVSAGAVYRTPPLLRLDPRQPLRIPSRGLHSGKAVRLLRGLGVELPEDLAERVVVVQPQVRVRCWLESVGVEERLRVRVSADLGEFGEQVLKDSGWDKPSLMEESDRRILSVDERALRGASAFVQSLGLKDFQEDPEVWERAVGKRFPEEFVPWLEGVPEGVELELQGELKSLGGPVVKGALRLEIQESSPDWFDLRVALSLSETELTPEEIRLLLEGKGKFVRLKGKGWRRLEFDLEEEAAAHFAELGLNAADLDGPPQRFHAVQLAASSAGALMGVEMRDRIRRRSEQLQMAVQPPIPDGVKVELRPYQRAGFHFLAYLSTNRFGGILADDMGLGKTLQTLTWLMWLRSLEDFGGEKFLVVCPKSVVQNWLLEAARFTPELKAATWRGGDATSLQRLASGQDLIVVNYAQLRLSAAALAGYRWHAVVLDEAQYIKNPASQTALSACALQGSYRLALSGTPIENRLLDLWSILQFAMPGLLGSRAQFQRFYDSRSDPMARRKLAARVRPFILRRNKSEVAKDLPARIEEDLVVEMEGTQALLYRAELKNARQSLLRIGSGKELDKQRFNVLTSLLRLRQICCHPGLVSEDHGHVDSAKMEALTDLLEPLMEEGHKVLVFSQFVEMLERVEREMDARGWNTFVLTGETENRGELVADFQSHEGSAVFLISLRAGGMGLNLTSASYVVLFDPWWNPAVENQAIDRTHRIGQTQQVIAYRLVAKDSIEQKIRQLQRSKSAMAGDVLGEEAFARALNLEDFHFLLGD
jgi:hypothetical protein